MKKIIAFLVILSITLLSGCGSGKSFSNGEPDSASSGSMQPEDISEDASAGSKPDQEEKMMTGILDEKNDFMFVISVDDDVCYAFSFDSKPDGLDELKIGDQITVTYTGTISEIDPFFGEIISVEKVESSSLIYEYTNLADDSACQKVDQLLEDAGISAERRKVFWDHVEQFNSSVDPSALYGEFAKNDILSPPYDPYDLQEQWMEKNPEFDGYNCRITAFELFGDYLRINSAGEIRDGELFMDREVLEEDDSALLTSGALDAFLRLYSTIPTEATKEVSVHAEKVQADWKKRGIELIDNQKASLITVWFHDRWSEDENELFVGHAGILLSSDDGLYFVEKLAFQEPYQVIRFDSRKDLETYLMKKYDTSWGQETAPPFIMENDQKMEGD